MLKLVSWIDSLPRLTTSRRKSRQEQCQKRRFELKKPKSTASTPLSKHKGQDDRMAVKANKKAPSTEFRPVHSLTGSARLAIKAIGRRRHTEPDAFQRAASPIPTPTLSPVIFVSSVTEDNQLMSNSWHPEGVQPMQYSKTENRKYCDRAFNTLATSQAVSCSVQDITPFEMENEEGRIYMTQSLCRPQIRTNPWVRPKSPRVIPALDLSRSGTLTNPKKISEETKCRNDATTSNGRIDTSVFSLRSSSGYGSGASQDSSPASSIHAPDWQHLSARACGDLKIAPKFEEQKQIKRSSRLKSREDVGLQCDFTHDKCVACTEEDFMQLLESDENGNIPMIDEDWSCSDDYDEGHVCNDQCEKRFSIVSVKSNCRDAEDWRPVEGIQTDPPSQKERLQQCVINERVDIPSALCNFYEGVDQSGFRDPRPQQEPNGCKKSNAILSVLHSKVELLKATGDQVSQAVRTAKDEQRKRNGELRIYEEQMQFLKQLKLVISNGFEVLV